MTTRSIGTFITLAVLTAYVGTGIKALASDGEQIYVLTEPSVPAAGGALQQTAFRSIGTVAGAQRLAVPENGRHILVLTQDGRVWTWGDNSGGQPGAGDLLARDTWLEVKGLDQVSSIAAGALHSVALKRDGTVWGWGVNNLGQLGSGDLVSRSLPGAIPGLSDVKMVAAGWAFTLALRADGTVWAFGANSNEIAPGEARRILMEPVRVPGLAGIEAIAVYRNRGYAKDNQGRFWVWGKSDRQENSAVTELSGPDAVHLTARVLRQFGDERAAVLQTEWQSGSVLVAGSNVEVVEAGKKRNYGFEGTVRDVDWGWAVALITSPVPVAEANASPRPLSASTDKAAAVGTRLGAMASIGRVNPAAAPVGTLSASQSHRIVVGGGTACGVGENDNAQLGDGTSVDRWIPVPVTTITGLTGMSQVATGWYHSLGLKNDGTLWAWGNNNSGALGDNTTIDKPTPFRVSSLTGIGGISAGQYHSVAVKNDGTVWAWGDNSNGQIGDGTTTQRNAPVQSILLSGVTAVAAGTLHNLALKGDGTVWAWGYNGYGQLGDGTTVNKTSAVQVVGLTNVIAIAAGLHYSLALKGDGTVWAWGSNSNGQLGDGSTTSRSSIVAVSGLTGVVGIAAGSYHSLAVKGDGTVWAWGYNGYGQLGDTTTTQRLTAVQTSAVSGFTSLTAVAAGIYYSTALKSDGTLWAWGRNDTGQLGNGTTNGSVIPIASTACAAFIPTPVAASPWSPRIAANQTHSLAVKPDGSLWAWGRNENGELGDGTSINRPSPVASAISGVAQISTSYYHSVAVKTDRTVWGWGYNANGQLGDGTTTARPTPVRAGTLTGVVGVAAGQFHSIAARSDGTVWSWGYNANGQLGNGTTTQQNSPVQTILLSGAIAVAAGASHSLALKSDGTVWGWGYNGYGQLGDGTTTSRTSAVQVAGLTGVVAIAAGDNYSMALRNDGTVWGWGINSNGQLGDGSTSYRTTIVRASGLTGVIAISAGIYHSLAVKNDGTAWAWGYNAFGQVGDSTVTQRTVPVQVSTFSGGLAVAAGLYFSLGLKNDGTIWGWGHNDFGQFGTGTTNDSTIPVLGPNGFVPNASSPTPLQFVPVTPCRVADTRNPNSPFGGPAIAGGSARSFVIPGSACGIPADAAAYSINVTVVPRGQLGFLTVWPTGQFQPLASTLNSLDGRIKANAAIVPAGTAGAISVYATDTTDAILDINGYFVPVPTASTLTFFPLTPCRIADTRGGAGALGGPFLAGGQARFFPVLASTCNVPATAQAYSLNFTAVPRGPLGFVTTWPTGVTQPLVSTLNAPTGQITANAAIVPVGAAGAISVYATNDTDLVIDINGYFAPSGAGGLSLYNLTPCRVLDTRNPSGAPPFSGTQNTNVVGSLCNVPANAQAYVFGATVVPPGLLGFLSLWPQGQPQPLVSTLNAVDGAITSNMAIVPTTNGFISNFTSNLTHLLLDISGYFAP